MKIPNILHLYWGKNKPMTWLRYMTAKSFSILNPNWKIIVWYPDSPGNCENWLTNEHKTNKWTGMDWFKELHKIENVEMKKADLSFLPSNLSDVHRSDIFRWRLLHEIGGWWSDFDILYCDPMSVLKVDESTDIALCWGEVEGLEDWLGIGFLAGSQGNKFFQKMEEVAVSLSTVPNLSYQDVGTNLLERFYKPRQKRVLGCNVFHINQESVYPFKNLRTQQSSIWRQRNNLSLKKTVGIHWYAGQTKSAQQEAKITPDLSRGQLKRTSGISWCFEKLGLLPEYIEEKIISGIKYSFLMPYADRPMVLFNTLCSLHHHYKDRGDFEVILVPDEKNQLMDRFEGVIDQWRQKIDIKVYDKKIGKDIYNPAIHYNIAAKMAAGKYLILTSPEIFHKNDVLDGFDEEFNLDQDCYIIAACRAVKQNPPKRIKSVAMFQHKNLKWFQHSIHRNSQYHFCCAISKKNYFKIGGFDERFAKGYCFDDDDFLLNVNDKIDNIVTRDDLLTFHQEHPNINQIIPNRMVLWNKNKELLEKKWNIEYQPK